jgi:WD40 repeat protein
MIVGATVLAYAPKHQLLISGGRKEFSCVFDLGQRQQGRLFQSHDSAVKAIAVDPIEEHFVRGSAEGNIKVSMVDATILQNKANLQKLRPYWSTYIITMMIPFFFFFTLGTVI